MRWVIALLLIALPLRAQVEYEPVFEVDDCPFPLPAGEIEGETLACGYLMVPENRADDDSELVELAVAVLYSPQPQPDPVIYLAGGPGSSALLEVEDWAQSPLRQQRDIILIDQRGTGYSYPALDCEEVDEDSAADTTAMCYDRLRRAGVDLDAYNSAANAADIAELWQTLGYDAVNLYGISYGTRLALTILRDHPEGVRSVVLDSPYPPQVAGLDEQALHGGNAILHLLAACAADPDCQAAYGDLQSDFLAALESLNDDAEMATADIVSALFDALYDSHVIPTLPYGLYLIANGDTEYGLDILSEGYTLADLEAVAAGEDLPEPDYIDVDPEMFIPDGDSEGMYNAVECSEEVVFNRLDRAEALAADLPVPLAEALLVSVEEQFAACAAWPVAAADPLESQAVRSAVPTLVLVGSFDPITPPAWGQAAAEFLENGYLIEVPYGGHGLIDSGECVANMGRAFIDNPTQAPDTTCLAEHEMVFYVPETCTVTPDMTLATFAGPGVDFEESGTLAADETYIATGAGDDGESFWYRVAPAVWVSEEDVTLAGDCAMLPYVLE